MGTEYQGPRTLFGILGSPPRNSTWDGSNHFEAYSLNILFASLKSLSQEERHKYFWNWQNSILSMIDGRTNVRRRRKLLGKYLRNTKVASSQPASHHYLCSCMAGFYCLRQPANRPTRRFASWLGCDGCRTGGACYRPGETGIPLRKWKRMVSSSNDAI